MKELANYAVMGGLRATIDPFWQTQFTHSMIRTIAGFKMNMPDICAAIGLSQVLACCLSNPIRKVLQSCL